MLHNDTETFEQLILRTSEYLDIKPEIIEKDYFFSASSLVKCLKLYSKAEHHFPNAMA